MSRLLSTEGGQKKQPQQHCLPNQHHQRLGGYESPWELEGNGVYHVQNGRHRPAGAVSSTSNSNDGSSNNKYSMDVEEGLPELLESLRRLGEAIGTAESAKEAQRRKVSIADRIGCYQWTWFTIVSRALPLRFSAPARVI